MIAIVFGYARMSLVPETPVPLVGVAMGTEQDVVLGARKRWLVFYRILDDRHHWPVLGHVAPKPIKRGDMYALLIQGFVVPESLATIMCIPDADIGHLRCFEADDTYSMSLLDNECSATLLERNNKGIHKLELQSGSAQCLIEWSIERRTREESIAGGIP